MNILIVGAHHDDIELGCGGTVARLAEEGNNVYGITLTNSETHYEEKNIHRTREQAIKEAEKAAKIINLQQRELEIAQSDNGELVYSPKLMRCLEKFIVENNVNTVFSHWQYDMNTDHAAASQLTIVAARHVPNILQFRSNWYQPDRAFNGIYYVDISEHIHKKIKSLEQYKIEIINRSSEWIDSFIDHNRSYGFSVGVEYAEVFEPVRISNLYGQNQSR